MYVYPQSVYFYGLQYGLKLLQHGQIWYHLIDNFMRNNFGKKYFIYIHFSFLKKKNKTKTVQTDQEPPKCGSTRAGDEGFLPHD